MKFLKDYLRNLALLAFVLVVLLLVSPSMVSQAYNALGMILGPILILVILVAALPRKRR